MNLSKEDTPLNREKKNGRGYCKGPKEILLIFMFDKKVLLFYNFSWKTYSNAPKRKQSKAEELCISLISQYGISQINIFPGINTNFARTFIIASNSSIFSLSLAATLMTIAVFSSLKLLSNHNSLPVVSLQLVSVLCTILVI